MKNLFKLIVFIIAISVGINNSFAFSPSKLEKYLKNSDLNSSSTVAISIRNLYRNAVVYEQNQDKLLHPASTLKIFTTFQALETLGYDYQFKTQLYKDSENNLYIKLGADPMLSTAELKNLFLKLKENGYTSFNNLYFDDSIIDKKEFAAGWMWDDDINPYTPKVSSYNLDGNIVGISMTNDGSGNVTTLLKSEYPMSVISNVSIGDKLDYMDISRYNWQNPELVEIYGNVILPKNISVPISSMRRYFIFNLDKIIEENKITITGTSYASKLVPENSELLAEIAHPITSVMPQILQNSNNLMAETVYKVAASVKYNATGTDELASYMFKDFYKSQGLEINNIAIKDGCGVSRNNLFSVSWMSHALNKIYEMKNFGQFKEYMAQAGDGTLSNRLFDLRGDAWLKTGSLSNISGISGFVKSQDGHTYAVTILIQNFLQEQSEIKKFEDDLIKIIYSR